MRFSKRALSSVCVIFLGCNTFHGSTLDRDGNLAFQEQLDEVSFESIDSFSALEAEYDVELDYDRLVASPLGNGIILTVPVRDVERLSIEHPTGGIIVGAAYLSKNLARQTGRPGIYALNTDFRARLF